MSHAPVVQFLAQVFFCVHVKGLSELSRIRPSLSGCKTQHNRCGASQFECIERDQPHIMVCILDSCPIINSANCLQSIHHHKMKLWCCTEMSEPGWQLPDFFLNSICQNPGNHKTAVLVWSVLTKITTKTSRSTMLLLSLAIVYIFAAAHFV